MVRTVRIDNSKFQVDVFNNRQIWTHDPPCLCLLRALGLQICTTTIVLSSPYTFAFFLDSFPECFGWKVCTSTTWVLGARRGSKRLVDPLEPELWMVVSHHVVASDWIQILCKSNIAFNQQAISLTPSHTFWILIYQIQGLQMLSSSLLVSFSFVISFAVWKPFSLM